MKHTKLLIAVVLGCMLILGLSACGAKEGTLTLINESTYTLERPVGSVYFISYGKSTTSSGSLRPGEWLQAAIDKNSTTAVVHFRLANLSAFQNTETWSDYIYVVEYPDIVPSQGFPGTWSTSIGVNKGDAKIVTVRDKIK